MLEEITCRVEAWGRVIPVLVVVVLSEEKANRMGDLMWEAKIVKMIMMTVGTVGMRLLAWVECVLLSP